MTSSAALGKSQCLTDELVAALLDGLLTPEELSRAHGHAAECQDCRELLVLAAHGGLRLEDSHEHSPELPAGWTPPEEFDEFRLVRPLGQGAMGVVYLAHDRSLDRQVAVKFIASHQPTARARERFQIEARAIARLQHPNVVTVFRAGEIDGHPYIVSEYLAGQSLAKLSLKPPWRNPPWRRVLSVGIGLARGLAAAHRQGVLHRDLKPDNVLLTESGEVKLLDFGLAELANTNTPAEARGTRAAAGTPRYMAPELFHGMPATPRSDLYSLGLLLHELCTGELPLRKELFPRQGEGLVSGTRAPPERDDSSPHTLRVTGVDLDFALLIERCLRSEPEERFASADALCAALERLHTPDALSIGNPYRGLAPFEPEHRTLFFGRDADIRAVLERLRRQPLVLIGGDSGAGKSSLCRAGVLSRVSQGALDESRDFSTLTLTPGRRPLSGLAAALAPLLGQLEAELAARLAETPQWLGPALRAVCQEGRGLLLFVDQLEELITLAEPTQAARFASVLGELALPSVGVRLLLTVRGDFLTRISALPGLGAEIERSLYLLRPLSPAGVRDAITGPARSRGVAFESEALLQTLTEAMAQGAGGLPLLQFTLAELWERRDAARSCITQAALEELGGVAGALSRHADAVLARLDRAGQQTARRLFGRLMTAEGTRSERSEDELAATSEETRAVLQALVAGRLLHTRTTEGCASYEIAHEALITGWSTMRRWLDEDAGQRALLQRIEQAGAEWERSGRAAELLWRGRPLDEARAIDTVALGPREQEFLRASRRAVRHQRQRRWAATVLVLIGVGAAYFGPRLQAHLEAQRFASEGLKDARSALVRSRGLDQRASASRVRALALFDRTPTSGPSESQDPWQQAEDAWAQALDELHKAQDAYAETTRILEGILARVPGHPEAYPVLLETLRGRIELAERFHESSERTGLVERFYAVTAQDSAQRAWLTAPATFELFTQPPGARVELTRYVDDGGKLSSEPLPSGMASDGLTPIAWPPLPAGSYHLRITREGYTPIDLPLLLERGQHERIELTLPAHVPEGYVYIPPGCFFIGSADPEEMRKGRLESAPLHRICFKEGYLIGRTEVTLGDWMAYLDTLPEHAAARHILEQPIADSSRREFKLLKQPHGPWIFSLKLPSEKILQAQAGELFHYPGRSHHRDQDWTRFPLASVSANDLSGYLTWLQTTGRLPGARLCSELEWTHAARGADSRRYPHGNRLKPDEANIDATYGHKDDSFGPDAVASHPDSVSPFGLYDMAGNVLEMTQVMTPAPEPDAIIQMGGAWYYSDFDASIASRQAGTPMHRDTRVGVRLCADFAPGR